MRARTGVAWNAANGARAAPSVCSRNQRRNGSMTCVTGSGCTTDTLPPSTTRPLCVGQMPETAMRSSSGVQQTLSRSASRVARAYKCSDQPSCLARNGASVPSISAMGTRSSWWLIQLRRRASGSAACRASEIVTSTRSGSAPTSAGMAGVGALMSTVRNGRVTDSLWLRSYRASARGTRILTRGWPVRLPRRRADTGGNHLSRS